MLNHITRLSLHPCHPPFLIGICMTRFGLLHHFGSSRSHKITDICSYHRPQIYMIFSIGHDMTTCKVGRHYSPLRKYICFELVRQSCAKPTNKACWNRYSLCSQIKVQIGHIQVVHVLFLLNTPKFLQKGVPRHLFDTFHTSLDVSSHISSRQGGMLDKDIILHYHLLRIFLLFVFISFAYSFGNPLNIYI